MIKIHGENRHTWRIPQHNEGTIMETYSQHHP